MHSEVGGSALLSPFVWLWHRDWRREVSLKLQGILMRSKSCERARGTPFLLHNILSLQDTGFFFFFTILTELPVFKMVHFLSQAFRGENLAICASVQASLRRRQNQVPQKIFFSQTVITQSVVQLSSLAWLIPSCATNGGHANGALLVPPGGFEFCHLRDGG